MRPDIQAPTGPASLPPAPIGWQRTQPARAPRRRAAVLVATAAVFAALVSQQLSISELRHQAAERSRAADERIVSLTAAQSALQGQLDALFDPAAVISTAQPSVFTLVAGAYQGSSFVLASDASGSELVTNFHVVRSVWVTGVRRVVVRTEGRSYAARIAAVRPGADLAIVEVEANLPALESEPAAPQVGDPVVVVGSPYGYGGTATTGIVSAIRGRYVQFSAPVSPGSSGGPVLDAEGRVVAVAAAKVVGRGAEGLSFAIPIDVVCRLTAAC